MFNFILENTNLPLMDVRKIVTEARIKGWTKEKSLEEAKKVSMTLLTKEELMAYASCFDDLRTGYEQSANLLLLTGPDGFDGTYDEYEALLQDLEEKGGIEHGTH